MRCISVILLAALCGLTAAQQDPNVFCFNCIGYPGHKYFWPVEGDCHSFYHCFYFNATSATGVIHKCPPGTYFHDEVAQCMPEGSTPCSDQCQNDAVQARGCYAVPTSCSTYFKCSNTASYGFCCPPGTRFNQEGCGCVEDETCQDPCVLSAPAATTVKPAEVQSDRCIDSFGVTLLPHATDASKYLIYDAETESSIEMQCARGSNFDLTACRCDVAVAFDNAASGSLCEVYLPFDNDLRDHSQHKFRVTPGSGSLTNIQVSTTVSARGGGSLHFSSASHLGLGIAGIKTYDFGSASSFCFFYQCEQNSDSNSDARSCLANQNVLSNSANADDLQCTLDLASLAGNTFWGNVSFDRPVSSSQVSGAVNANGQYGFNQACVVYDGTELKLYINNDLKSSVSASGHLKMAHCALIIGYGHHYGAFQGYIDEVLICRRAISASDVDAHFQGQDALRSAGLVL